MDDELRLSPLPPNCSEGLWRRVAGVFLGGCVSFHKPRFWDKDDVKTTSTQAVLNRTRSRRPTRQPPPVPRRRSSPRITQRLTIRRATSRPSIPRTRHPVLRAGRMPLPPVHSRLPNRNRPSPAPATISLLPSFLATPPPTISPTRRTCRPPRRPTRRPKRLIRSPRRRHHRRRSPRHRRRPPRSKKRHAPLPLRCRRPRKAQTHLLMRTAQPFSRQPNLNRPSRRRRSPRPHRQALRRSRPPLRRPLPLRSRLRCPPPASSLKRHGRRSLFRSTTTAEQRTSGSRTSHAGCVRGQQQGCRRRICRSRAACRAERTCGSCRRRR